MAHEYSFLSHIHTHYLQVMEGGVTGDGEVISPDRTGQTSLTGLCDSSTSSASFHTAMGSDESLTCDVAPSSCDPTPTTPSSADENTAKSPQTIGVGNSGDVMVETQGKTPDDLINNGTGVESNVGTVCVSTTSIGTTTVDGASVNSDTLAPVPEEAIAVSEEAMEVSEEGEIAVGLGTADPQCQGDNVEIPTETGSNKPATFAEKSEREEQPHVDMPVEEGRMVELPTAEPKQQQQQQQIITDTEGKRSNPNESDSLDESDSLAHKEEEKRQNLEEVESKNQRTEVVEEIVCSELGHEAAGDIAEQTQCSQVPESANRIGKREIGEFVCSERAGEEGESVEPTAMEVTCTAEPTKQQLLHNETAATLGEGRDVSLKCEGEGVRVVTGDERGCVGEGVRAVTGDERGCVGEGVRVVTGDGRGCEGEGAPSVGSSGYGGSREGSPEEGGLITVDMKEEEKRLRERESREQSLGEEVCVYVCVCVCVCILYSSVGVVLL